MICNYLPAFVKGKPSWAQYYAKDIQNDINATVKVLKNAGYSNAVIAGILGNMYAESGFKESAINKNNGRRGYFQHLQKDYNWLVSHYGHGAGNQARYIVDWDKNPKKVGLYTYGYKPKNTWNPKAPTPEAAADSFLNAFERAPGQRVAERRQAARAYFNWLQKAGSNIPAAQQISNVQPPRQQVEVPVSTRVAQPIAQPQPTSYIDPSIMQQAPEEVQEPSIEDNLYASVLPNPATALRAMLQGQGMYVPDETNFLDTAALPGAREGKSPGVHINPANRGKFNATKKRTGKTTEELAHSSNPLTRKRAIFAMNARKWRH